MSQCNKSLPLWHVGINPRSNKSNFLVFIGSFDVFGFRLKFSAFWVEMNQWANVWLCHDVHRFWAKFHHLVGFFKKIGESKLANGTAITVWSTLTKSMTKGLRLGNRTAPALAALFSVWNRNRPSPSSWPITIHDTSPHLPTAKSLISQFHMGDFICTLQ